MEVMKAPEKNYGFSVTGPDAKLHIVVMGVGGTGGYVLSHLAKIKALGVDNARVANFDLTIVDGDLVEQKNCKRQMFFDMDIGENKAEVLASRYGEAYGTDIAFVDEYIESVDALKEVVIKARCIPVIVGCVDNHKTRQMIDELFMKHNNIFWIDAGNEELSGQVVCGYNRDKRRRQIRRTDVKLDKKQINTLEYLHGRSNFDLPTITEIDPSILKMEETKFNSELSCAERAEASPQNIFVNSMSAQIVMMFLRKVLTGERLTSHAVTFSLNSINTRTLFNNDTNFKSLLKHYDEVMR